MFSSTGPGSGRTTSSHSETLTLTPREVSDLDMLASGALSPLEGFMGQEDYERVVEDMHLAKRAAVGASRLPRGRRAAERRSRRPRRRRRPRAGRARRRGGLRVRQGARGRAAASARPTTRIPVSPGSTAGSPLPRRQGHRLRPARAVVPGAREGPGRDAGRRSPTAAGGASSASRPATRSTARTST